MRNTSAALASALRPDMMESKSHAPVFLHALYPKSTYELSHRGMDGVRSRVLGKGPAYSGKSQITNVSVLHIDVKLAGW
jgi:hypothetical protein